MTATTTPAPTYALALGARDTPLVVSVPHSGDVVPDEDAGVLALSGRALLRDADLFVDRLYAFAPARGAALLQAHVSRYVVDVNRAPDDVDREVCPDIERPGKPSARGLCWRITTDGAQVLSRPLRADEVRSRIARVHTPYHAALSALLEERRARFGFALLLDAHSMPSLGRPAHTDPGARRADIVPGDVRGTSCAPSLSRLVGEHFEKAGFSVRFNDPYMGGYITRFHGRPARGIHAIQLELNRDLYMDEDALRFDERKAERLGPHLLALIERLTAFVP